LTRYFSRFSGVKAFLEHCVNEAREKGYVKTLHGRRLSFASSADLERDIARVAKNMPIQGSAAELAKVAMTRVHNRLSANFKNAFLVNMIHDELVVECDFNDRFAVGDAVKFEMMEAQRALFQKVRPEVDLQFVL
jgi:DNA polymerase-1